MTYCLGILLNEGLVLSSDTRTNAGVDQIATFRKVTVKLKSISYTKVPSILISF